MNVKHQQGFTLIELMIVVAIIGILAAIAIPAYQEYAAKAQAAEGLSIVEGIKKRVEIYIGEHGKAPADRTAIDLSSTATDTSGRYVESVEMTNGEIVVTYRGSDDGASDLIAANTLAFVPWKSEDNTINWQCGVGPIKTGWTGITGVAATGSGTHTNVQLPFLPAACKDDS